MERPARPTKAELAAARDRVVENILAPDLTVLFCGINPGLHTGATGHHFAGPGNRFWRALFGAGFTERLLTPAEDRELLHYGLGITNLVARTTARADELTREELREGAELLGERVAILRPHILAVLGIGAYATAFGHKAAIGLQDGSPVVVPVYVLPNPSGLQAQYQLPEMIELFADLRRCAMER